MADRYDYRTAVADDVREYVKEEIDLSEWVGNKDGLAEKLNDDLWDCDSVTGNASGSYTFSTWKAEENLCHNWDLLEEALTELGFVDDSINYILSHGAEAMDVTIRCYLLSAAIDEVLDEFDGELVEKDDGEE